MKPLSILNDIHLGVSRVAGTTPDSAAALRDYLLDALLLFLRETDDSDVLVAGDLFDAFEVDSATILETYAVFAAWLEGTRNTLYLVAGNHDWSPRANKVSSFHMLAYFLSSAFPSQVKVYDKGLAEVRDGVWVISHVANQDLFELEIAKAMEVEGRYLLTHCNVMPPACHGKHDHSLTLSEEQCKELTKKFQILNAHEHQHFYHSVGKGIHCLGNQWPSSVSDCLAKGHAQADGRKFAHIISDTGVDRVETWRAEGSFALVDWRHLADSEKRPEKFIRVVGSASAQEAEAVISAISKFRSRSDAYVVTNAVAVEGQQGLDELAEVTFEGIKSFDVLEAIIEELEPREAEVIKRILKGEEK